MTEPAADSIDAEPARMPLTERAYRALRARLIAGHYRPNEYIDLNNLIAELKMSRTPVREACLRLQAEEMVEILPQRGIRVKPLSADDLNEIYQIISGLELEAAALLARQRPQARELAALDRAVGAMETALDDDDPDGWAAADESFHRGLLALSGNSRLARLGCFHRDVAQRAHFVALRLTSADDKRQSIAAHRALIAALVNGQELEVRAVHLAQRQRGADLLVQALTRHGLTWL